MLVIPISFLTEHIETLHEINIEAREQAESLGITEFHMMPALNDSPLLIRALADLVAARRGPSRRRRVTRSLCNPQAVASYTRSVFISVYLCSSAAKPRLSRRASRDINVLWISLSPTSSSSFAAPSANSPKAKSLPT